MPANQSTVLRTDTNSLEFLKDPQTRSALEDAAGSFVKHINGTTEIWAASRDWFLEEWGRDTFISLPGLLLTTKRYEEAQQVFQRFAEREQGGLIPNIINGDNVIYNTADAPLWFIHALKSYLEATEDWSFGAELLPTVRNIIAGYKNGTEYERFGAQHRIGMNTTDGLISSPPQATWMDADPSANGTAIVTPRNGKCVEINALWYGALRFAIEAQRRIGDQDTSELSELADYVKASFASKFWNDEAGCLFDVIEGDSHGTALRSNQIIAISRGGDIVEPSRQAQILTAVQSELLTAGGLRTLSPHDLAYQGQYDTSAPMAVKDLAYHQGTTWPWLIGPYCDALDVVRGQQGVPHDEIKHEIGLVITPLVQFCLDSEFKSLPEVFSGDPPHDPGGTTAQAWSVAEVLRIFRKWF
jgi:predicted glycogen debranching enzyme